MPSTRTEYNNEQNKEIPDITELTCYGKVRDTNQNNQVEIVCLEIINSMKKIKSEKKDERGSPNRERIKT